MQCAEYYEIDKRSPSYLRLLHLIRRIRMQRARVMGCKKVKRLEEHIESLQEEVEIAVNEFDQFQHVPATAIFNHIEPSITPDSWEYSRAFGDDAPILRWDWMPNPDSEPEEVEEPEDQCVPPKAQTPFDAKKWLSDRRKRRWC